MVNISERVPTVGLGIRQGELAEGQRFKTFGRTITEADIVNFIGATGMVEVLFTNVEYLRNETSYAGRLVPGALVFCLAEGLLMQTMLQGTGIAFLNMELDVKRPSFAGDTIHVEVEIVQSRTTSQVEKGIVKTTNRVVNQRGETVMVYSPVRMVKT